MAFPVICTCMAMCTCRATEHGKWNNITSADRYGFILRQELGVDPTSTSGYEDTPKDTILDMFWIRIHIQRFFAYLGCYTCPLPAYELMNPSGC